MKPKIKKSETEKVVEKKHKKKTHSKSDHHINDDQSKKPIDWKLKLDQMEIDSQAQTDKEPENKKDSEKQVFVK